MSQPYPQPPQQPAPPNPYAQPPQPMGQQPGAAYPPPAGYPQQPGQPGAYPPPAGYVVPAPAVVPSRFGAGLMAAVGAALAAVFIYAAILRYTDHEIGYVALAVGLLVGAAAGKAGGRNAALPILAAVISLLAVWFGQLVGIAWMITHHVPELSFGQVFFDHFSDLVKSWKDNFIDAKDILFFAIAGVEGFVVTRRMAQR